MAIMRAMFVGQGKSGLPEDRFVNTWHFSNTSVYEDHVDLVWPILSQFYSQSGGLLGGMARSLGEWLSPWVDRAAELVFYDLNTAPPRVPTVHPITMPSPFSGGGFPEEVALCMSLKALDPPHSPRRRGRLYFGPFNLGAGNAADNISPARPTQPLIDDVIAGAEAIIATAGVDWMIRSTRPTPNYVRIGSVWVDNAWDTQRRRGPDATARTESS